MKSKFKEFKWAGLISFALVYNVVYLARFNINYTIDELNNTLEITSSQETVICLSVYVSYAVGSFINGLIADRHGAKRVIAIGVFISILMNLLAYLADSWQVLVLIWTVNGYFQSMIWIGGIVLLSKWWKEGERGIGIGIANFSSGLSHVSAYLLPLVILSIWPDVGTKANFVIPMGILIVFVIVFQLAAVERPEVIDLEPYGLKDDQAVKRETELRFLLERGRGIRKAILNEEHFLWWCAIAMLSSICRYGLLNWIPKYYETKSASIVISDSFINLALPIGMACGTLIITWIAEKKFVDNKGLVITVLAALCGTLVVVFPMLTSAQPVLIGIFLTGFALYGINGILWLYAIDVGIRVLPGTAAGILNAFAYLGAFMEGMVFPGVIKLAGGQISIFVLIEALCIIMVICGLVISRKNTNIMEEELF